MLLSSHVNLRAVNVFLLCAAQSLGFPSSFSQFPLLGLSFLPRSCPPVCFCLSLYSFSTQAWSSFRVNQWLRQPHRNPSSGSLGGMGGVVKSHRKVAAPDSFPVLLVMVWAWGCSCSGTHCPSFIVTVGPETNALLPSAYWLGHLLTVAFSELPEPTFCLYWTFTIRTVRIRILHGKHSSNSTAPQPMNMWTFPLDLRPDMTVPRRTLSLFLSCVTVKIRVHQSALYNDLLTILQGTCEAWTHFTCRHSLDVCTVLDSLLFCRMRIVTLLSRSSAHTELAGVYRSQCPRHPMHTSWGGTLGGSDKTGMLLSCCVWGRTLNAHESLSVGGKKGNKFSVLIVSSLNNCLRSDHRGSFIKALAVIGKWTEYLCSIVLNPSVLTVLSKYKGQL